MEFNDDEIVALLNRLLEKLHQADSNHQGSTVINIYGKGSLHVDHVDNQNFYGDACPKAKTLPDPPCVGREEIPIAFPCLGREKCAGELPEVLATPEAMALWRKAQQAGYVGEHYQPLISRTQAALLADTMAQRLGIKEKWKTFGELWNRQNMYKDYYNALNQQQSLAFQDRLKALFD